MKYDRNKIKDIFRDGISCLYLDKEQDDFCDYVEQLQQEKEDLIKWLEDEDENLWETASDGQKFIKNLSLIERRKALREILNKLKGSE